MKFCAKVAFEINFSTTLCMLDLKFVWRHYDGVNKGGPNYQNVNANDTNIASPHFVMVILLDMFWYLLKGHNTIGSFIWLVTLHWTTFLFIKTQLCSNSIPNEGCEYLHVFELKGVQESLTLIHIVKKTMLCQRVPSLPWLVFTSIVNIGIDHIFELDQWNHAPN